MCFKMRHARTFVYTYLLTYLTETVLSTVLSENGSTNVCLIFVFLKFRLVLSYGFVCETVCQFFEHQTTSKATEIKKNEAVFELNRRCSFRGRCKAVNELCKSERVIVFFRKINSLLYIMHVFF